MASLTTPRQRGEVGVGDGERRLAQGGDVRKIRRFPVRISLLRAFTGWNGDSRHGDATFPMEVGKQGHRGREPEDGFRSRMSCEHLEEEAGVRVMVVIPMLGEDASAWSRLDGWLSGIPGPADWVWDVVVVEDRWAPLSPSSGTRMASWAHGFRVLQSGRPGRGRALKDVWMLGGADVFACVDPGLRTSATRLASLVSPLRKGVADLVVGARIDVVPIGIRGWMLRGRSWLAERLTRWATGSGLHDHRSGVIALTAAAVHGLVPHVRSTRVLFEMELLLLAQQLGWRLLEIPLIPAASSTLRPGMLREFSRVLRAYGRARNHRLRASGGGWSRGMRGWRGGDAIER